MLHSIFYNYYVVYSRNIQFSSEFWPSGGVGRNASLPHSTKRRITTNLKTIYNQNCQNSKLHGTLTTKELKKHSSRTVGGAEMGRWGGRWGTEGEDLGQGNGRPGKAGAGSLGN